MTTPDLAPFIQYLLSQPLLALALLSMAVVLAGGLLRHLSPFLGGLVRGIGNIGLFGALLHATWNTLVKASADKLTLTVLVCCAAGLWSIPAVLLLPAPAPESWRFIAQSTLIHLFYFSFVGLAYARVDLSVAYPLMRGLPPLATTAIAIVWLGETVGPLALAGVGLVSAGVMALLAESSRSGALDRRALAVVTVVAATVVAYTLNDALGARASGHAGSYLAWLLLLIAPGMLAVGLATRGPALLWATARATSWPSSLWNPCCWPWWAAASAWVWACWRPGSWPTPSTGPC